LALCCIVLLSVGQQSLTLDSSSSLNLQYSYTDSHISFTLSYPKKAWLGFGPNTQASMLGTDAAVCLPDSNKIGDAHITARTIQGVKDDTSYGVFTGVSVVQNDSGTFCSWTRPLLNGTNGITITPNQAMFFNWAIGQSNTFDVHANKGTMKVNLAEGISTSSHTAAPILVHGAFMVVIWGILVPLAVVYARYYKTDDGTWFKVHKNTQLVAMTLLIVSFSVIVGYTRTSGDAHFRTYHSFMGLVIFIACMFQALVALVRPAIGKEGKETTKRKYWGYSHRWTGRLLVFFAGINILTETGVHDRLFLRVIWVLLAIMWTAFAVWKQCKMKSAGYMKQTDEAELMDDEL